MGLFYTKIEERWNSLSHGAGILLGIVFGFFLIRMCVYGGAGAWATFGVWLYLAGMLSSYISSTWYHALRHRSRWKPVLRKWDHAAIYWHIAGSYSPITLLVLREQGFWGWGLFIAVWGCALLGTVMSFRKLKVHSHLETISFIGMGLIIMLAFKPLYETIPHSVYWIIAEGVCYITGALFYSVHKVRYMHTVFHFFVLAGSLCHLIAVWDMLVRML